MGIDWICMAREIVVKASCQGQLFSQLVKKRPAQCLLTPVVTALGEREMRGLVMLGRIMDFLCKVR